jgi:hypothetical protein
VNKLSNLAAISLAPSIVLPVLYSVNHSVANSDPNNDIIRGDGWPLPPLPPRNADTIFADGWPLPPLPPRNTERLLADGWPLPPLPPRNADTLFADGWPLPPLPPGRHALATV